MEKFYNFFFLGEFLSLNRRRNSTHNYHTVGLGKAAHGVVFANCNRENIKTRLLVLLCKNYVNGGSFLKMDFED